MEELETRAHFGPGAGDMGRCRDRIAPLCQKLESVCQDCSVLLLSATMTAWECYWTTADAKRAQRGSLSSTWKWFVGIVAPDRDELMNGRVLRHPCLGSVCMRCDYASDAGRLLRAGYLVCATALTRQPASPGKTLASLMGLALGAVALGTVVSYKHSSWGLH